MRTIRVCKAEEFRDVQVPSVQLIIEESIPATKTQAEWSGFADVQAEQVVSALMHLPQGVADRVLAKLMERKLVAHWLYQGSEWLDLMAHLDKDD